MTKLAIVYHSGYGHTARIAEHVQKGASRAAGVEVSLLKADDLTSTESGPWDQLDAADAIIFGAPTYMGTASAVFGQFKDATSKVWMRSGWRDKIAAGFTNSGSWAGDKEMTLLQMATLAAQHGMIWVSYSAFPGFNSTKGSIEDRNRTGHFLGLGTQSPVDAGADAIPASDLQSAEDFGQRVAEATLRWVRGRQG